MIPIRSLQSQQQQQHLLGPCKYKTVNYFIEYGLKAKAFFRHFKYMALICIFFFCDKRIGNVITDEVKRKKKKTNDIMAF